MARYRLNEAHYLGEKWLPAGTEVDWPDAPSRHMTPIDDAAQERKAAYDAERPHFRASRDLPPRAAVLHDPAARQPGQPRIAGPPNQEPTRTFSLANAQAVVDTAEAQKKFAEQEAERDAERAALRLEVRKEIEEENRQNAEREREVAEKRRASLAKANQVRDARRAAARGETAPEAEKGPSQADAESDQPERMSRPQLEAMTKAELHAHAEKVGAEVNQSANKDEIIDAIVKAQRRG